MLDAEKKEPLYQQLYNRMKEEILVGELLVDEKIPSTRFLAETLQVSRSTVEMAYGQLIAEGYIRAIPYRGYFVEKNEVLLNQNKNQNKNNENKKLESTKKKEEQIFDKKIICDFSPNGVDRKSFPLATWKSMYREVLKEHGNDLFSMGKPFGEETLRKSISTYLYSARGVRCKKEQIVVGAGNDYLLMLLSILFKKKSCSIGMSNATYKKAYQIFDAYGILVKTLSMDALGISVKELNERKIEVLYTMPSHHFPTGVVMPIGRRMELLNWAKESKERYIIEDDYDSEFRYRGKPVPALAASDSENSVIYMGTFSKSLAPAIRISYMVLPITFVKSFKNIVGFFSSSVSRLDQMTLHKFMDGGYFERHIHRMRKLYKSKRDFLLEQLKLLRKDFEISGEDAGLHLLITDKRGRDEKILVEKAKKVGVRVYGLSSFNINIEIKRPATILIGYAEINEKEIEIGVRELVDCWIYK